MTNPILPGVRQPYTDAGGNATVPFHAWCSAVDRALQGGTLSIDALAAQFADMAAQIGAIEPGLPLSTTVTGGTGVVVNGSLAAGAVVVSLGNLADNGTGTLLAIDRDAQGRIEGTRTPTTTDLAEGTNLYFTDARARAAVAVPKGYIDGLRLQWVSTTALTVSSGSAYIEGSGSIVAAPSAIAKTGLSLSASTWYHVYLYLNAGTPDIEIVTTAPATAYSGTARSKTGDTSRRYVGSVKAAGSGALLKFTHAPTTGGVTYLEAITGAPFSLVSNGLATTETTVSMAGAVPATASGAAYILENNATAGALYCRIPSTAAALASGYNAFAYPQDAAMGTIPVDSSQNLIYMYGSAPSGGGAYISISGYTYER